MPNPATPMWTETDYPAGLPTSYVSSGGSGGSPYALTLVTNGNATVCLGVNGLTAQYVVGVINNCLSPQAVTLLLYDSASSPTGPIVASCGQLGVGQIVTFPAPGLPVVNGCVAQASGTPLSPGIQILCR